MAQILRYKGQIYKRVDARIPATESEKALIKKTLSQAMKDLKEVIELANKNYQTLQRIEKTCLPKAAEDDSRSYEKLGGFALDALKGVFRLEHHLEFYENLWKKRN